MPHLADPLDPEHVAAAVAPIIDRIRKSIAGRAAERAHGIVDRYELAPWPLQTLAMLRNTLPDRSVTRRQVEAVLLYTPQDRVAGALGDLVRGGLLEQLPQDSFRLTSMGQTAIGDLYGLMCTIVEDMWSGHESVVAELAPIAEEAVAAAQATGGAAFDVLAPPYEPPGVGPAILLAERLTPLRFHRFDAHAEAWSAAGLTLSEVQALGPGPLRDRIETETNRLAAAPYAALTPTDRFALCAGLGALPN